MNDQTPKLPAHYPARLRDKTPISDSIKKSRSSVAHVSVVKTLEEQLAAALEVKHQCLEACKEYRAELDEANARAEEAISVARELVRINGCLYYPSSCMESSLCVYCDAASRLTALETRSKVVDHPETSKPVVDQKTESVSDNCCGFDKDGFRKLVKGDKVKIGDQYLAFSKWQKVVKGHHLGKYNEDVHVIHRTRRHKHGCPREGK